MEAKETIFTITENHSTKECLEVPEVLILQLAELALIAVPSQRPLTGSGILGCASQVRCSQTNMPERLAYQVRPSWTTSQSGGIQVAKTVKGDSRGKSGFGDAECGQMRYAVH